MNEQKPSQGRVVLVTTPGRTINGQDRHAALITQVWPNDMINVTIFPGSGPPESIGSIHYAAQPDPLGSQTTWMWPPRV